MAIGTLIIAAGVACCQLSLPNLGNPNGLMLRWIAGAALILVGVVLVLPQLYVAPLSDGRFARAGTFLASFSYSLYLTHAPVLRLQPFKESHTVTALWLARYVLVILICMAWAFLFSRCFETVGPALKARIKRWTGQWSARRSDLAVDVGVGT